MVEERLRRREASENYSRDTLGGHPFLRWLVYEYAEPPIDFDGALVEAARLKPSDTVVDLGFGNGYYLYNLYKHYGLTGRLIGVDPNPEQFEHADEWGVTRQGWEQFKKMVEVHSTTMQAMELPSDLQAEVVASNYSFYKLKRPEQEQVIEKIKELLRKPNPDTKGDKGGRFIVATSGKHNKEEHRKLENNIATFLTGYTRTLHSPPPRMNRSFTSEYAAKWLPRHFQSVRHIPLAATDGLGTLVYPNMIFYGAQMELSRDIDAYYLSLSTMADQYDPVPRGAQLRAAMNAVVVKPIEARIRHYGYFYDRIVRDVFECIGPKSPNDPQGEVQIRNLGELALNA